MSLPNEILPVGFLSSSGTEEPYLIERSLRFNSGDSSYLSRTPASAGNRKTFTFSFWCKRTTLGTNNRRLFGIETTGGIQFNIMFASSDAFYVQGSTSGAAFALITSSVYRDVSAWYHIVVSFDTSQSTESNRARIYINGSQITEFSTATYPTQDILTAWNVAEPHYIGSLDSIGNGLADAYLADIHFIDGQSLTPTSFGKFDTNGIWQPKKYSGSTPTGNSFWLPFSDNSSATATTLGKDGFLLGNNWTPKNLFAYSNSNFSYSNAFDGSGDSVSIADNAALRMGTGDFTIEFWVRFNTLTNYQTVVDKGYTNVGGILIQTIAGSGNFAIYLNQGTLFNTTGSPTTNTWYHFALVRSGTTVTAYRNGTSVGSGTTSANFNDTTTFYYGGSPGGGGYYLNGHISNFRVVKGTAVYTSSFSPPISPLTNITNTSLLTAQSSTFVDNSTNAFTVTANGNASVGITTTPFSPLYNDSFVDSPNNGTETDTGVGGELRGNYCTWNPLKKGSNIILSDGNLKATSTTADWHSVLGTIGVSSGKWYWEITSTSSDVYDYTIIGIANENQNLSSYITYDLNTGKGANFLTYLNEGDVVACKLDMDAGTLQLYLNNVAYGAQITGITGTWFPAVALYPSGAIDLNCGQRPFKYTAPSGYKALCTTNLPTPTILKGSDYFDTKLYTGNGSTQTISGLAFSPDFVWVKPRSNDNPHQLFDAVRGDNVRLKSNATDAEYTYSAGAGLTLGASGFTVGTDNGLNQSGQSFVGWTWDAGSSNSTNTQGSITSTVRANASAGFSVVTGTAPSSGSFTYGHGLGVVPSLVIFKDRSNVNSWVVHHSSVCTTSSQALFLNGTGAVGSYTNIFGSALPTSSVAGGLVGTICNASANFVAYCFAPVAGYSAFGSYTGNGSSSDGPFVFCNFRPRWIMIKKSSASSSVGWYIHDTARDTYNLTKNFIAANSSAAEVTAGDGIDILSNGFKLRATGTDINDSSQTFIYAAFAENPFSLARAR